jgi:hypothetical protein
VRRTDLLVVGSSPDIYRVSLEEGRFLTPLASASPALNACGLASAHGMFAAAGEDGVLECFDLRQRRSLGVLDAAAEAGSVRRTDRCSADGQGASNAPFTADRQTDSNAPLLKQLP